MRRHRDTLFLVSFLAILIYSEQKHYHSIGGPFKVVIRRLQSCPPEFQGKDKVSYYSRDVRTKYTQEPTYSGNATFPFPVNNTLGGAIRVASWSNMGGWKDNAHIFHTAHLCTTVRRFLPALYNTWMLSIYGEVVGCQFYPGFIRFENFIPTMRDVPVKDFLYGRWRADALMEYSNGQVAACVRALADTVPV